MSDSNSIAGNGGVESAKNLNMLQSLYVQPFWLWLYDNLLAGIGLEDVLLHSRLTDCHQLKGSKGCTYSDSSNIFKFEPSCPWNKLRGSFQGRQIRGRVVHGYFIPTARVWDCPREIENCEKTFYPPSGNFSQTFVEENKFSLDPSLGRPLFLNTWIFFKGFP